MERSGTEAKVKALYVMLGAVAMLGLMAFIVSRDSSAAREANNAKDACETKLASLQESTETCHETIEDLRASTDDKEEDDDGENECGNDGADNRNLTWIYLNGETVTSDVPGLPFPIVLGKSLATYLRGDSALDQRGHAIAAMLLLKNVNSMDDDMQTRIRHAVNRGSPKERLNALKAMVALDRAALSYLESILDDDNRMQTHLRGEPIELE